MKVTPIDILHKAFTKKIRGYDTQEVYDFLQEVSESLENVVRERNHLKEQLRQKELMIMEYKERDEVLKKTITTATKVAENMNENSKKKAQVMIADAHKRSELIIKEAQDSLSGYYKEIGELRKVYSKFDAQLRTGIHTHLALLDQMKDFLPDSEDHQKASKKEITA